MAGVSSPPWPWEKREAARRPCPLGGPRRCLDKSRGPAAPLWGPGAGAPQQSWPVLLGSISPGFPPAQSSEQKLLRVPGWRCCLLTPPSAHHTVHGVGHTWAQEGMGDLNLGAKQVAGAGLPQLVPELCPAGHREGPAPSVLCSLSAVGEKGLVTVAPGDFIVIISDTVPPNASSFLLSPGFTLETPDGNLEASVVLRGYWGFAFSVSSLPL